MLVDSVILTIIAWGVLITLIVVGLFTGLIGGIMLYERHSNDEAMPYVLISIICWALAIMMDIFLI